MTLRYNMFLHQTKEWNSAPLMLVDELDRHAYACFLIVANVRIDFRIFEISLKFSLIIDLLCLQELK